MYPNHPFGQFGYQGAGYSPIFGQQTQQPYSHYGGMPGGQLGGAVLEHVLNPFFKDLGMVGLGLGSSQQNIYDRLKAQRLQTLTQASMQAAAAREKEAFTQTFRGAAEAFGVPYGPEQQAAAEKFGGHVSAIAPFLAQIPGSAPWLDALAGQKGSSTSLMAGMSEGSRYRIDPLTGQMGLGVQSRTNLMNSMYDIAGTRDVHYMKAGEMGDAFTELQRRGLVAGPMSEGSAMQQLSKQKDVWQRAFTEAGLGTARDASSLSPAEIDKLGGTDAARSEMKKIDAKRVNETMKNYSGAITAMREIFGPNAPMAVLINALEQMTQGGLSQMQPQKVESLVRTMNNLAKSSGIGLEGAMLMMQQTAAYGQQLGISPLFASDAVMGGMAFASAYNGLGGGSAPTWGLASANQLAAMDANLRQSAVDSPMANQMATAMRIRDNMKGKLGGRAGAYVKAVDEGTAKFMSESEYVEMMTEGGMMTEGQVRQMLDAKYTNQEYIKKHDLGSQVRAAQFETDILPEMARGMAFGFKSSNKNKSQADADAAGAAVADALRKMDPRSRADSKVRNALLADVLKPFMGGASDDQLRITAETMYGASETELNNQFGMTNANALALGDERTLKTAKDQTIRARAEGVLQSALAGKGQGGIVGNLVEALQGLDLKNDPDAIKKLVATTLGGVDADAMNSEVGAALEQVHAMNTEGAKERDEIIKKMQAPGTTAEQRKALEKELHDKQEARADAVGKFVREQEAAWADRLDLKGAAKAQADKLGIENPNAANAITINGRLVVVDTAGVVMFEGDVEGDASHDMHDPVPNSGKAGRGTSAANVA